MKDLKKKLVILVKCLLEDLMSVDAAHWFDRGKSRDVHKEVSVQTTALTRYMTTTFGELGTHLQRLLSPVL